MTSTCPTEVITSRQAQVAVNEMRAAHLYAKMKSMAKWQGTSVTSQQFIAAAIDFFVFFLSIFLYYYYF